MREARPPPGAWREAVIKLPEFDYACPETLDEAIALLAGADGEGQIIAGGQSLLPMMAFRLAVPGLLVDLRRITDLRSVEVGAERIRLGAMTRWRDMLDHADLARALPILPAALQHVAHYQVRNRGTVGGSLAHADPASEFPCIALLCGAEIEVAGPRGRRWIAAGDLSVGPMQTSLGEDEILLAVELPRWPEGRAWGFEEFAFRHGDFAVAATAVCYDLEDGRIADARVAVMAAVETPMRLAEAEDALNGQVPGAEVFAAAGEAAAAAIAPVEDGKASAAYRRGLVRTLLTRGLGLAQDRMNGAPS